MFELRAKIFETVVITISHNLEETKYIIFNNKKAS